MLGLYHVIVLVYSGPGLGWPVATFPVFSGWRYGLGRRGGIEIPPAYLIDYNGHLYVMKT